MSGYAERMTTKLDEVIRIAMLQFPFPDEDVIEYVNDKSGTWYRRVQRLCLASPGSAGRMTDRLNEASDSISDIWLGTLDSITGTLVDWEGEARDSFDGYVNQLKNSFSKMDEIVIVLRDLADDHRILLDKAREDLSRLLDNAATALGEDGGGNDDTRFGLMVVSAVLAVASAPLSGGASIAVAAASAAAAITAESLPEDAPIAGGSKREKLQSMHEGIEVIRDWVKTGQRKLQAALGAVKDEIAANRSLLRPATPLIATPYAQVPGEQQTGWDIEDFTPRP